MNSLAVALLTCLTSPISLYASLGDSESQNNKQYGTSHEHVQISGMPLTVYRLEKYIISIGYDAHNLADYMLIDKRELTKPGWHYAPNLFSNEELETLIKNNLGPNATEVPVHKDGRIPDEHHQVLERRWIGKDNTKKAYLFLHLVMLTTSTHGALDLKVETLYLWTDAGYDRYSRIAKASGTSDGGFTIPP